MTAATCFVAYYRVSTDKRSRDGLGLDAQCATVEVREIIGKEICSATRRALLIRLEW